MTNPIRLTIPAGNYLLGISGGADSTALALLARDLPGVCIVLAHLNHELRGAESDEDERFVREFAQENNLELVVRCRSEIEPVLANLPANPSARYRAVRRAMFAGAIQAHHLDGVLLAHHADDQAETILLRLARGGGILSLRGMQPDATVSGVRVLRPLLEVQADDLRAFLRQIGQRWREDSSNASPDYRRNIARAALRDHPELTELLCDLSRAASEARTTLDEASPDLPARFATALVTNLPAPIARHALRRWLIEQGADADDVSHDTCQRLLLQTTSPDAAPRQHYPGKILVRRRQKHLDVIS